MEKVNLFWFRRDLRIEDNAGLYHALREGHPVVPVFIFDTEILGHLEDNEDLRVKFIHDTVAQLKEVMQKKHSDLLVRHGKPLEVWKDLLKEFSAAAVYSNHDYESKAKSRDAAVEKLCRKQGVEFHSFKDQVIFEKDEVLTDMRKTYTVYTPYKKKWLHALSPFYLKPYPVNKYLKNLFKPKKKSPLPRLQDLGFKERAFEFPPMDVSTAVLKHYAERRDFPSLVGGTSHLGLHLRFGTVSVRKLAALGQKHSPVWLSELIWRDFFMQILHHFPHVEEGSFRPEYDKVKWRTNKAEFEKWCQGQTGYPLVDAGMRELNATGFMHNRVRMVTASFLTKHLLMHWSLGERYFARKLLDYDLAANNGNWQWAAGTGCDAAPYFRVFNPTAQQERFDKNGDYVRKWVPEWGTSRYPEPMVVHSEARDRALLAFKTALKSK